MKASWPNEEGSGRGFLCMKSHEERCTCKEDLLDGEERGVKIPAMEEGAVDTGRSPPPPG